MDDLIYSYEGTRNDATVTPIKSPEFSNVHLLTCIYYLCGVNRCIRWIIVRNKVLSTFICIELLLKSCLKCSDLKSQIHLVVDCSNKSKWLLPSPALQYLWAEPCLTSLSWFIFSANVMVSGKRLADIGYRVFSGSMMLLTVYGGYLCVLRGYRYMERQKQLKLAAENQDPEVLKDWRRMDFLHRCGHSPYLPFFRFCCPSLNHEDIYSSQVVCIHWGYCDLTREICWFLRTSRETARSITCISGLCKIHVVSNTVSGVKMAVTVCTILN